VRLPRHITVITLALLTAFPAAVTATPALAQGTTTLAHTGPSVFQPDAGIDGDWNKPMCAANGFERIKTPTTEYAAVDSAGTCISSAEFHANFTITSVKNMSYQMPVIASGYVPTGEATCASSRDTCYKYPVPQEYDGMPVDSFRAWLASGKYSLAFDTWFSPVASRHSYSDRAGDTEVMICLADPNRNYTSDFLFYTEIDGLRFGVMSWETTSDTRYVAYVAVSGPGMNVGNGKTVSFRDIWLNPFWRNAESHGWLKKTEDLWAVDLGFELTDGGRLNNIHDDVLAGVR